MFIHMSILDKLKQNDPQEIANLEQELKYVSQGAHRWYVLFVCVVCVLLCEVGMRGWYC